MLEGVTSAPMDRPFNGQLCLPTKRSLWVINEHLTGLAFQGEFNDASASAIDFQQAVYAFLRD